MQNKFYNLIFLLTILASNYINCYEINITEKNISSDTTEISLIFDLNDDEILYNNSLRVSATEPNITISEPKTNAILINKFDTNLKENLSGYTNQTIFKFEINKNSQNINNTELHVVFKINNQLNIQERFFKLNNSLEKTKNLTETEPNNLTNFKNINKTTEKNEPKALIQKITIKIDSILSAIQNKFYNIFNDTTSLWIKVLMAFFLGLLLSLTPCLYPMIPMTVGILQSSAQKTVLNNFILSFCYTLGISSIFAVFGLVTVIGTIAFGQLQSNGFIVIPLILLLLYLGLSMFGFYEMYIPKWIKPKNKKIQGGSKKSAFLFGIISGTVASSCLSPGLALILSHVAKATTSGAALQYINGFILLFVFGIGSSFPLLIIGTFSNSINLLPKAGSWMIEIKRILGLMLIWMALNQMEKFIPAKILIYIKIICLVAIGIYYFKDINKYDSPKIKAYKNLFGTFLIIAAFVISKNLIDNLLKNKPSLVEQEYITNWQSDFNKAKELATKENKRIILKFETKYCPACRVLDKKIFKNLEIDNFISKNYIAVKINGDNTENDQILKDMQIQGFPTVIIFNLENNIIIKKWVAEVGTPEEFLIKLEELKSK